MNSPIKVIDDVVSRSYQNRIEDMFSGLYWKFQDGLTYRAPQISVYDGLDLNTGFVNVIYNRDDNIRGNPTSEFLLPLLYEGIDNYRKGQLLKEYYRIRAVMWIKNQNKDPHIPHCDLSIDHYTMIYYVHDTDGPTRFHNDNGVFKEVPPKKGRAVIFPGNVKHSSSTPTKNSRRMIINFNFLI